MVGQFYVGINTGEACAASSPSACFRVIKRQFGYVKVRYHNLTKNDAQVMTLFALANLWMARRSILTSTG